MKTVDEWSQGFDLLYDNITSGKAPGVVPFEKSLFLTNAQDKVTIALYKGQIGDAFEATEELTAYLDSLVKQAEITTAVSDPAIVISDMSSVWQLPTDLLFRTLETCVINTPCVQNKVVPVIPVTQDEFMRTMRDPFKGPNENRVLRLSYSNIVVSSNAATETRYTELISKCPVVSYKVRYLKYPDPIILTNLTGSLKIRGQQAVKTCLLPEAIHQTILAEAVAMAKAVWTS